VLVRAADHLSSSTQAAAGRHAARRRHAAALPTLIAEANGWSGVSGMGFQVVPSDANFGVWADSPTRRANLASVTWNAGI